MGRRLFIIGYFLLAVFCVSSGQDSLSVDTAATQLREVVVEGRRAWVDNNRMVFVPDRYEKKFSNSPFTLINEMNLPEITATDDQIFSRTGPVDIYINGQQASKTDLSVFLPKDVVRVEYIENPRAAGYGGASAVINFVMRTYIVGGLTKISADQTIRNNGNYGAAAKLVYKKNDLWPVSYRRL